MAIPNRYFADVQGLPGPAGRGAAVRALVTRVPRRSIQCIRPRRTSGRSTCGAATPLRPDIICIPRARFPKEYRDRIAFINEPTAHLIGQAVLEKQGAGFVARDGWNLISSAEEWFAPVASMVGPDGAVWFADWYNFIAQHNPTPTGIQRRQRRGVRDVDARSPARPHLPHRLPRRAGGEEAIAVEDRSGRAARAHSPPTTCSGGCTRSGCSSSAGRRMSCRSCVALVRNQSVDEIGTNGGAFHALWTLQGLGELDTDDGARPIARRWTR